MTCTFAVAPWSATSTSLLLLTALKSKCQILLQMKVFEKWTFERNSARFFNLMLGAHNVRESAVNEPNRVEITATKYDIYPSWDSYTLRNDIALIKLPEKITFNGNTCAFIRSP